MQSGLCLFNICLFLLPQYLSIVNIPHGLRHLKKLSFLETNHYIDYDIVFIKQNVDLILLLATAAASIKLFFSLNSNKDKKNKNERLC